jgi:plasmid stability protein
MPVNLSIKDVPDDVVARLRERAALNHRSLQGELLTILETALALGRQKDVSEIVAEVRRLGIKPTGDATAIIRADRDRDYRR